VYDEDGVLADMLGWYQNYLDNITAEELASETISDNEEIILIITLILFLIGIGLAIYTKNRILFFASGLLFFVPIVIVNNIFIIIVSAIMMIMLGVIAFYDPNKEGFES
jgi:predicted membrane protein